MDEGLTREVAEEGASPPLSWAQVAELMRWTSGASRDVEVEGLKEGSVLRLDKGEVRRGIPLEPHDRRGLRIPPRELSGCAPSVKLGTGGRCGGMRLWEEGGRRGWTSPGRQDAGVQRSYGQASRRQCQGRSG